MHNGQYTAPCVSKLGRPTRLTVPIRAVLAEYLEARRWAYLDEMVIICLMTPRLTYLQADHQRKQCLHLHSKS